MCDRCEVFSTSDAVVHVFLLPVGHLSARYHNILFFPEKCFPIKYIHHNSVTRHNKFNHLSPFPACTNGYRWFWYIQFRVSVDNTSRTVPRPVVSQNSFTPSKSSQWGQYFTERFLFVPTCLCTTNTRKRPPVHNLFNITNMIRSTHHFWSIFCQAPFPLKLYVSFIYEYPIITKRDADQFHVTCTKRISILLK